MEKGKPLPLGSNCQLQGVNFALFAANASKVELCLFDQQGRETRYPLPARSGDIWHGFLTGIGSGAHYAYRVYGPWNPTHGLFYNPNKLLLDPYARALTANVIDDSEPTQDNRNWDDKDNANTMPKCVVVEEDYDWQGDGCLHTPWSETIIYEAHVKGLTKRHPAIPAQLQGTYAGLAHPVMLDYFQQLGITAIQLLPIQHHTDERVLVEKGLSNYWGYNMVAPFVVEPRYAVNGSPQSACREFKTMVKALHNAGIEVILDVVFNHSAEHGLDGPTLSFRGIDNRHYYWLSAEGDYLNWTGCGNSLQVSHPFVVQLILDCLRYWHLECHVDGFRFDLASVLGRTPEFVRESAFFIALQQDPDLSACKLIVEPWDMGIGGYQLGQFMPWFAEWNDQYRDEMRRFWLRGDLSLGQFAMRFAGSADIFQKQHRPVYCSINYLACHDGFTLYDLVSFNQKYNDDNGEQNQDGMSQNYSHNHGQEGEPVDVHLQFRRESSIRALLTTLFLSLGTPMLLAGDERGHTQRGNNNAYCQDNEISWLDWQAGNQSILLFVQQLIMLRKTLVSTLYQDWWGEERAAIQSHLPAVTWFNKEGVKLVSKQWQSVDQYTLLIQLTSAWLCIVNASPQPQSFVLPAGHWQVVEPFSERECVVKQGEGCVAGRCCCVLRRGKSEGYDD